MDTAMSVSAPAPKAEAIMPAPKSYREIDWEKPSKSLAGALKGKKVELEPFDGSFEIAEPPPAQKFTKDELKAGVQRLSQRLVHYLNEGNRMERLMAKSSLKELSVMLGILTEKMLLLEGQPTQIISQQQHQKIDQVMPALLQELQRRGLKGEMVERKMTVTVPSAEEMGARHQNHPLS
jgi:hypothetical protein